MCDNDIFWYYMGGMSSHTKQTLFAEGFGEIIEKKKDNNWMEKKREIISWNLSACYTSTSEDNIFSAVSSCRLVT